MNDYDEARAARGWAPQVIPGLTRELEERLREVRFEPGHPMTEIEEEGRMRNYGHSTLKIRFILHGPDGAVAFVWSTGIYPERATKHVPVEFLQPFGAGSRPMQIGGYSRETWMQTEPEGRGIVYHSPVQLFDWAPEPGDCDVLPTGVCFSDQGNLDADTVLEVFLTKGEEAMWEALESRYTHRFITDHEETP